MGANLERMLAKLHAGEIGFSAFVAGTRTDYRQMAEYLMRRWRMPEWFTATDCEQELYLGTWRCLGTFDASRGVALGSYVVFTAMTSAKRAMHKARGAGVTGNPGKRPSRFERVLSSYGEEGDGATMLENRLTVAAEAEEEIGEAEVRRRSATTALRACATKTERYAVLAIREAGSLDSAAALLYDDVDHRTTLRLGSEEQAERFVRRHAGAVARRMVESAVVL